MLNEGARLISRETLGWSPCPAERQCRGAPALDSLSVGFGLSPSPVNPPRRKQRGITERGFAPRQRAAAIPEASFVELSRLD